MQATDEMRGFLAAPTCRGRFHTTRKRPTYMEYEKDLS